jgi:hypothetical protein
VNAQLKERMLKARNELVAQAKDYEYPDDCVIEENFFFALGVMDAALGAALKVDTSHQKALAYMLAWNDEAADAYIAGRGLDQQAGRQLLRDATELTDADAAGMTVRQYRKWLIEEREAE